MVSKAVKNTESDKIESNGAADSAEFSLNSMLKIGFERTDIPIAHGMEIIAANFRQDCMTFAALTFLTVLSVSVLAILTASRAAVSAGVKEEAIGVIKADGRCDMVTASVL